MPATSLREMYNLRRYIQHEMAQHDYGNDEDDFDHPLSELNWTSQTRGKYMKFIIMNSTDPEDFEALATKTWLVLQRASRWKRVHTPH